MSFNSVCEINTKKIWKKIMWNSKIELWHRKRHIIIHTIIIISYNNFRINQSKYNNKKNLMKICFFSLNVGKYIKNAYTDQGPYGIDKTKIYIKWRKNVIQKSQIHEYIYFKELTLWKKSQIFFSDTTWNIVVA